MVEKILAARRICVTYETVRPWGKKFGKAFADQIRQRAPARGDKWHLDEVLAPIAGEKRWLWRAVDQNGFVLDVLVQREPLVKGDIAGIARAIALSRATMRNIRQNLVFAFAYNGIGIPIAARVLYPTFGLLLSPIIAALAMSLSSVSVIANALRLRTLTLRDAFVTVSHYDALGYRSLRSSRICRRRSWTISAEPLVHAG